MAGFTERVARGIFQKRARKRLIAFLIFFSAVACVCCIAAYSQYSQWRHERAAKFFSSALEAANTDESVSIGGKTYRVKDGSVLGGKGTIATSSASEALRLAYEKTLARRDPLLSLAGTDPADLAKAIASLKEAQQTLAQEQSDPTKRSLVLHALYPIDFLTDAAALEADRQTFLGSGSESDSASYEAQLGKTIADYLKDVAVFQNGFEQTVPMNIRQYSVAGVVIDRNQMLAAIHELETGMRQTQSIYEARLACLDGALASCNASALQLPTTRIYEDAPLSPQQLANARAVRELIFKSESQTYDFRPLIETNTSVCAEGTPIPPVFSINRATSFVDPGTILTTPELVGDMRFEIASDFLSVPFEQFFASRGIQYLPSAPELHYECPSMQRDFGNVFAVEEASELARTQPASAYVSGAQQRMLRDLEKKLSDANDLLNESDAQAYADAVESAAQKPGAPQPLLNEAAQLGLIFKDPSAGFARAIAWITEVEKYNTEGALPNGVPIDLSAATLFYYRSGFLITFMGDNSSAIPGAASYFASISVPENEAPYAYYSELLADSPQNAAVLARDTTAYYDLHRKQVTSPASSL